MVQQLYIASVRITSPRGRSVKLYRKTIFTSMYDSLERFLNTGNTRKLAKSENHPEIWPLVSTRILTQFCVSPNSNSSGVASVHVVRPPYTVQHKYLILSSKISHLQRQTKFFLNGPKTFFTWAPVYNFENILLTKKGDNSHL